MREALLQRALGDLILLPSIEEFDRDPSLFGGARDLAPEDAESLARQKDRFLLYRDLARNNLVAPLENTFPVLRALLGEDWEAAAGEFIAARSLQSPYYRDIAPAFVAWLAEASWGQDRWPALLELAHYEYLELLVTRWADEPGLEGLAGVPSAASRIVLDPAARVVSYAHAVHRASEAEPDPVPGRTHLLLYRDPAGDFGVFELTESLAALLVRAQAEPMGPSFSSDLGDLLVDLVERGALRGFRA